jgi:hypothetical protein
MNRILRYLKSASKKGLVFLKNIQVNVDGYEMQIRQEALPKENSHKAILSLWKVTLYHEKVRNKRE